MFVHSVENSIVAGAEAAAEAEPEPEPGPKEQHNYYMATVPDFQCRFGKHKDIPGC